MSSIKSSNSIIPNLVVTPSQTEMEKKTRVSTSEMVTNAIKELNERKGSSLQAIKKFIISNYNVDIQRLSPFIKKFIRRAVASGTLLQKTGKGASGSFKLAPLPNKTSGKKISTEEKKSGSLKKDAAKTKESNSKDALVKSANASAAKSVRKVNKVDVKILTKAAKQKVTIPAASEPETTPTKSAITTTTATKKVSSSKTNVRSKEKQSNKGRSIRQPKTPKPKSVKAYLSRTKNTA